MQASFFKNFPLFADLDDRELAAIAAVAKTRHYAKDDVVFYADENGEMFYLIRQGQVKVTMTSPEGKEIILSLLGPGEFLARWRCSMMNRGRRPSSRLNPSTW